MVHDALSAGALVAALEAAGVTHVVGLPDNASAALFHALADHQAIRLVSVTREGEACALAAGLWLGGAVPLVSVQNTGLLESGDALRGTAARMGCPLVLLVGWRGRARTVAAGLDPAAGIGAREDLVRPDADSAALMTLPTLDAWGIPWHVLESDVPAAVNAAFRQARSGARPVALLLPGALT